MTDWRNDAVTEKQMNHIIEMSEHSEYPLPTFNGKTKGEAYDYIQKYSKLAHESLWSIEHGY